VGMFSDAAIRKLNDIFDNLFKPPADTRTGTLVDLGICTDTLHAGQVNQAYDPTVTFQATGGTAPYTWAAENLPAGLTLNANTGVLSGTPTGPAGPANVKITVTDHTNKTASRQITLTINP
jgi:Putative Ig domain